MSPTEKNAPQVSINLCCYNGEKYLEETLESIITQTFKDWELVVINDGSTDATERIVHKYIRQGWPIIYHAQPNAGLGAARNKALELSRGRFIAFIDQDDLWMPAKLARQIPLFADPRVGLVYCDTLFFNNRGDTQRFYANRRFFTGSCFRELLAQYFLSLETVMLRRSALDSLDEYFDPRYNMVEEGDLFRRIGYAWKLAMVPEPLAKWRVHAESWSWQKGHTVITETESMLAKYTRDIPGFTRRYAPEIAALKQSVAMDAAFYLWKQDNGRACRTVLKSHVSKNRKAALLFILSLFPAAWVLKIGRVLRPHIVAPG